MITDAGRPQEYISLSVLNKLTDGDDWLIRKNSRY